MPNVNEAFAHLAETAQQTFARVMPGLRSGGVKHQEATGDDDAAYPLEICNWIVFGHVWNRPGLSTRERRILTISEIASAPVEGALRTHVRAALNSGDLSPADLGELITHFAFYAGMPRASALNKVVQAEVADWRKESGGA